MRKEPGTLTTAIHQSTMRALLLLALAVSVQAAEPDAEQLVRSALDIYLESWQATRNHEFVERVRKIDLDKAGREKKLDIKSFQVLMIDESPHKRLVSRFDKSLSPEEEESERIKVRTVTTARSREKPGQRKERIRKYHKQRQQISDTLREIPAAFEFALQGTDEVGGRSAWVIGATPRQGYRPKTLRARIFTELEGKLWIDQASGAWLKVEGELVKPVTFGLFLVRLHRGARTVVLNEQIGDGLWSNTKLWYRASLRIGLVKSVAMDVEHLYSEQGATDARGSPSPRTTFPK